MFDSVDKVQLLNGSMAFIAFVLNARSYSRLHIISSTKYKVSAHLLGTLLLWYSLVNLVVAFGVLVPQTTELIKYYRWAFWVLVGSLGCTLHFAADKKIQ